MLNSFLEAQKLSSVCAPGSQVHLHPTVPCRQFFITLEIPFFSRYRVAYSSARDKIPLLLCR